MKRFWTRVALGAAAVFIVGMFVVTLGRQGISWARGLADGDQVSIPLAMLPFRADGERAGTFRGVEVRRDGELAERVLLTVRLGDRAEARQFADCAFAVDLRELDPGTSFACLTEAEARERGFVQVGEVVLEPAGLRRPLMVPADEIDGFDGRRDRVHRRDRSQDRRVIDAQAVSDDGEFRVTASASTGETLRFRAGDDGAVLVVRDKRGKRLVNLTADEEGGVLTIRDGNGKQIVRVNAAVGNRH